MMKNLLLLTLFINIFLGSTYAQNTVGLLSYQPSKSFDGYNLIYPHNQPNVYLLNNCGEVVHIWEDDADFRPGNTAYLLDDGRLVKTKRPAAVASDPIWAGGGGATIEIRDWDNNLQWSYTLNNAEFRFHHDIAITPDGTILAIVWEYKSEAEAIQAGRDTALLPGGELWPEIVIEIDPATDEIIWEWKVWDHLIQDFDGTKDNFGVVADHPELIDINFDTHDGDPDWLHANALDYDPINDQIVISIPYFNEIWVVDHSTTTAEAATGNGGLSGRGGDLMYRWGNPLTYGAGTAADQQLFFQHDIHWVDDFLDFSHPYYGKMAVFNNQVGADFSTANVINQPFDMYDWEYTMENGVWGPDDFELTITHPEPTQLYSTGLSSTQFLPNGNSLICSGRFGYAFELTPDNELVWEYKTPLNGGAPATQGDTLEMNNNLTFRMTRFPKDYSAFDGKDLSPIGFIELNPDTEFCQQILPTNEVYQDFAVKIFPNPASDRLVVEWEAGMESEVEVFDLLGQRVFNCTAWGGRKYLDVSAWKPGIYFVQIDKGPIRKVIIQR